LNAVVIKDGFMAIPIVKISVLFAKKSIECNFDAMSEMKSLEKNS
jgi:hypothetical protein